MKSQKYRTTPPAAKARKTMGEGTSQGKKTQAPPASPCEKCKRACNFSQCRSYRLWIDGCWNRYHAWLEKYRPVPGKENVWRYQSPTIIQDYLREGPCRSCAARAHCPDNKFCKTYEVWHTQRWERLRRALGYGGQ